MVKQEQISSNRLRKTHFPSPLTDICSCFKHKLVQLLRNTTSNNLILHLRFMDVQIFILENKKNTEEDIHFFAVHATFNAFNDFTNLRLYALFKKIFCLNL